MSTLQRTSWIVAGLLATAILAANVAEAQTARTGGTANAQLLQQLQQLASERTALQAENTQLKKDLDATRKDRDALKKAQQAVEGKAKASEAAFAHSTAERESSQRELQQQKDKMQELITKFRETVQSMRDVEVERSSLKQTLASSEQDLKVCVGHNAALYKLNAEVLDRFEHQSMWSRVASVEPFTRIKRVQLENLVDDYKSRADDHVLKSGAPNAVDAGTTTPPNSNPPIGVSVDRVEAAKPAPQAAASGSPAAPSQSSPPKP